MNLRPKLLLFFILAIATSTASAETIATQSVSDLIERILPGQSENFALALEERGDEEEKFLLTMTTEEKPRVSIRANSLSALSTGFGYYLREYAQVSISWFESAPIQVQLPLPPVPDPVERDCSLERRFFLNYCTYGYTMPWWQWREWERFIDWMAINGVNTPLAITGQEAIWLRVWQKFGLSEEQIRGYFSGPAHLPWHRMANIDRWQGPLPLSYIEHQESLQKKILPRQRSLGMTPVLPGFAGHVPIELLEVSPESDIKPLGQWAAFEKNYATYFLDPLDPLFPKIQKAFLDEQARTFETDHIYGIDPFNEIDPPSWEPDYLHKVAGSLYDGLAAADPDAIWLQMGWLFFYQRHDWTDERIKALLSAVPEHRMILLDYYVEKSEVWRLTENFFNTDFIWCTVGNFGGQTSLMGNVDLVSDRYWKALEANKGKNMIGVGSTLEGMGVNEVMHQFLLDLPWQEEPKNEEWFQRYARSRSGSDDPAIQKAWKALFDTIYSQRNASGHAGSVLAARFPSLDMRRDSSYSNAELLKAWEHLLAANESSRARDAVQYDLVNVVRQVLVNHLAVILEKCRLAYDVRDLKEFTARSQQFLELAGEVDQILSTRSEFLAGKGQLAATEFGKTESEKQYYLQNSKVILTTWGPKGHMLSEYARRDRAGLISSYYLPRWETFFDRQVAALVSGNEWDRASYIQDLDEMAWNWTQDGTIAGPVVQVGDSFELAQTLFEKYHHDIANYAPPVETIVGEWNAATGVNSQFERKTWSLNSKKLSPGPQVFSFRYSAGADALRMKNVQLFKDGKMIAEDLHEGWTGHQSRRNAYLLEVPEDLKGEFTLQAEIATPPGGGRDSAGHIYFRKAK